MHLSAVFPKCQCQVDSSADEGCIPKVFQLLGFGLAQARVGEIAFKTTHVNVEKLRIFARVTVNVC